MDHFIKDGKLSADVTCLLRPVVGKTFATVPVLDVAIVRDLRVSHP
jgi:hypothetical protein